MPEISEGRITVPVFFYPDKLQKQAMWQTITDAEESAPSAKLAAMQSAARLSASAKDLDLWNGHASEILQLCQLGFPEDIAKDALISHGFDIERALQVLLEAQGDLMISTCDSSSSTASSMGTGRWRSKNAAKACTECEDFLPQDEAEVAIALSDEDAASQAMALAMHLEELERTSGISDVLHAQFQQYEAEIDRLDAEDGWGGTSGDLMATRRAQQHLTLEGMEKAMVYSIGHGDLNERAFFEVLQLNSIRILYDTRPTDYRHELLGVSDSFSVRNLKMTCKARGIFYKQMVIGRETAYGTLAHLRSDQGKHILTELAWQAKRKPTAFLGRASDWGQDPRLAIAQELCTAGHRVQHISSDGSCQEHVHLEKLPDWLITEEERLRKLEKMRQSGEMKKPQKSAVDRSSEVIASHSMRPAQELDAMAALQEAQTQPELQIAQQKLTRIQRISEMKELPNKVLTSTPGFIKEEARVQAEWIAQRKLEKQKGKTVPPNPEHDQNPEPAFAREAGAAELQVECIRCGHLQNWADLQKGDGACQLCRAANPSDELSGEAAPAGSSDLLVDCQKCGAAYPWSVLALGDGLCSHCFEQQQESAQDLEASASASSSVHVDPKTSAAAARSSVDKEPLVLAVDGSIARGLEASTGMAAEPVAASAAAAGSWRSRRRAKAS